MELSLTQASFLDSFTQLWTEEIGPYGKNKLNLFMLKINANEFNYNLLIEKLLDPMIDYSISRKVKEEYQGRVGTLSKKARTKFVEYCRNNGELGELLLYCFLETHLKAPKILTKLELKTSTSMYVNGADGVHFFRLPNGNYQLIFGESKTFDNLTGALSDAFTSIYNFKNEINEKGNRKSGINYEKSLISDNLLKETFSDEDRKFLERLIYPTKNNTFEVDDAFGVFIGFEITVKDEDKWLPAEEFRKKVTNIVSEEVEKKVSYILKKITDLKLQGHSFYIYILPFTDINTKRKEIMEELTV